MPNQWPPCEDFWDRLQRVRRARKVENAEIAAVAGVAVGTVSNWKQGQKPEVGALLKLARYFEVAPEWLLDGEGVVLETERQTFPAEEETPIQLPTKRRRASGEE